MPQVDHTFKHMHGNTYERKLDEAVEAYNDRVAAAVVQAEAGPAHYRTEFITDHLGVDHVLHEVAVAPGEDTTPQRLLLDADRAHKMSLSAFKQAPDGATMVFYQLHDVVLVPGNATLDELGTLNLVCKYGSRGVLRRHRSKVTPKGLVALKTRRKGLIEYWGPHDETKLVTALLVMTKDKRVRAGEGPRPEVDHGNDFAQALEDMSNVLRAHTSDRV